MIKNLKAQIYKRPNGWFVVKCNHCWYVSTEYPPASRKYAKRDCIEHRAIHN